MNRLIVVPVVLAVTLAGCATLSNPKTLAALSRVGVVSVTSNADVGWFGQGQSNGGLLGAAMNLASSSGNNPNGEGSAILSRADNLIGMANNTLLAAVASSEGTAFVPERRIVDSAAYREATGKSVEGVAILKPKSYKFVSRKDTALSGSLKSQLGLDGDIFAFFQFDKMMKSGVGHNGTMGAHVGLTITVVNPEGKTIFEKRYLTISKESIAVVAGVYDPKSLEDAFSRATKTVCAEFAADLGAG